MKNRIISVCLTLALCVGFLAVPAMADETRSFINVLDYSFPNGGDTPWVGVSNSNPTVSFDLPYYTPVSYVDVLIEIANGVVPTNVYLKYVGRPNQEEIALSIVRVGGNLYRIFGEGTNYTQDIIGLKFVFSGTNASSITFKQFNISYLDSTAFFCPISGNLKDLSVTPMRTFQFAFSDNTAVNMIEWTHSSGDFDAVFQIDSYIPPSEWTKYDYIDLLFNGTFASITSILVEHDYEAVPYEVSYLGSSSNYQQFVVAIRIDVSDLERHSNKALDIDIYGLAFPSVTNKFELDSCVGYATAEAPNLISYWFLQLEGWFDELISALGGNADTSDMQNNVDQIQQDFEDANNAMNELERPDIDSVIPTIDIEIDNGSAFADTMGTFFENEWFVSVITASMAFMLFGIIVG